MKYLSVCSGIEAASVAWHPLGWEPVGFSEIEPFPSAVLAHHYPDVPNFGDMTKFEEWNIGPNSFDLLVGGCPCQAFSTAGLREGLNDDRGNLTLTYCELANHFNPEFIVYENVPGILSDKTNAFGCLLAGLAGEVEALEPPGGRWKNAGYVLGPKRSVAWRVLDAQYFGVAQRRRRVFVVASAGNICASEVLFEREGVRRNTAPLPERSIRGRRKDLSGCLDTRGINAFDRADLDKLIFEYEKGRVRRPSPEEAEMLQGFPKGFTDIPYGRPKDTARYKAIGNSMAVPCMRWIGRRIDEFTTQ